MSAAIRPRRPLLLVSTIAAIAILLAFTSYQFFNDAANKIVEIAAGEDRTSARILAHDLANSLANKLQGIQQNVEIIAQSPPIQEKNVEKVKAFLRVTQQTSNELTDFYGWLDKDGRIIWASGIIDDESAGSVRLIGADRSDRDWFINARDTGKAYVSSVDDSLDGVDRLFISYPIIDSQSGRFEGVIYSGMPLAKINNYLGSQLPSGKEATTSLMDMKGNILQTQYPDLLGMNYFSKEYQAAVARMEKVDDSEALQKFVRHALAGPSSSTSDVVDFAYGGQTVSTAYSYVKVGSINFAVIFTRVPHVIAANVEALIDQQRLASWARIAVVGAAAAFISTLIIFWNRRLEKTVAERTQELASKTDELSAANEQLKQNDKLQKEFVDIAAHELRTPITPILTSIDTAEIIRDSDGENRVILSEEFYRMILRNVKRLEQLSSDLLQAARIESGTLRLSKEKFDLNKLIDDVVVDASRSLPDSKRDIQIAFEPRRDKEELIVEADQTKLFEVVTNIVQNAIKFTVEGKIVISTEKKEDDVGRGIVAVVKIKDTGSGIAQDILPRLFQKFASASSSNALGGTGLGLYVSKNIVEAHGGKIWAENNADDKGATFSFSIPLSNTSRS
jgi:signal transduction histidine kinase